MGNAHEKAHQVIYLSMRGPVCAYDSRICHGLGTGWKRISRHETEWEGNKVLEWETLLKQRASSRENQCWTGVLRPLLYPGYKVWDRGLVGHLLIGWGMITGSGKSRTNTFSLWGRRRDRLYCSINSYNMGEGRMIRVWFFHSKTFLGFICSFVLGSPQNPLPKNK